MCPTRRELDEEEHREMRERIFRIWEDPTWVIEWFAPDQLEDERFRDWMARFMHAGASPAMGLALRLMNLELDVRAVLPAVRVPTLVLHRVGDAIDIEQGRFIAERVPGARLVELPGRSHAWWLEEASTILGEIEEFVTGRRGARRPDRILATVLFTDIVGSTELAGSLGDQGWRDLLERERELVRAELARWRGVEVETAGDGFLARFDGPARAIRCARELVRAVRSLGLEVRCGLHTGEMEIIGKGVAGIAVHVGARIAELARPGEVLVSRTVRDLVAGAGFEFVSRGTEELKGVSDRWEIYGVT